MKVFSPRLSLLTLILLLPWAVSAEGVITADPADGASAYHYDDGQFSVERVADASINIGRQGAAGVFGQAAVFPFQLPDYGPVAAPFQNAQFTFRLNDVTNRPNDVDLYALPPRSQPDLLPASPNPSDPGDFFMGGFNGGPSEDPSPDVTIIQPKIITGNTPTGNLVSTHAAAGNALADFLNDAYANGAGAGQWVFLRLSPSAQSGGTAYFTVASADAQTADNRPRITYNLDIEPPRARPFIWVTAGERDDILEKIANYEWAQANYNSLLTRRSSAVDSHQADRDAYVRGLPVNWDQTPSVYITAGPTNSDTRFATENRFNAALDAAILYYLTQETKYAELAGDILHNVARTLTLATPSSNQDNGGLIIQNDFLYEARLVGTQMPMVYDFLYDYLLENQVYDVQTGGMVPFAFAEAQDLFRLYYNLARTRGFQSHTNWHALMSTCMLHHLMAIDDEEERESYLQVYLVNGPNRQRSLAQDYGFYSQPGNILPESLQYANAVPTIRSSHMVLIDRYDSSRDVFGSYPNFPLSLPRINELRYPNNQLIRFGNGPRTGGAEPFFDYELVYAQAVARGDTELAEMMGGRINAGIEAGLYNRNSFSNYSATGRKMEPLKLLWGAAEIPEPPREATEAKRTDRLPFAGITLQRNLSPLGDPDYGLMGFIGGAGHTHSHAGGMNMELYGLGHVLGAKGGIGPNRSSDIHRRYYRTFAGHNTIIVNGGSRGDGGWQQIDINTVQSVAMEPAVDNEAVSPNHSFSVSSFNDNKGNLSNATQQRTLALVRTSAASGFYVDFFRSNSPVTNRTAQTLDGPVTDQYHDYIYRNVGELNPEVLLGGSPADFTPQPDRFQNDIGDQYQQPGWRYFENTRVTHPENLPLRARFTANLGGQEHCMTLHMPAVASREVALVESPQIDNAPGSYGSRKSPTLVIRQFGEAHDRPFAAVYEPHFGEAGGTVQNVTHLEHEGVVVGVKVESLIQGVPALHYVIAHPSPNQTFEDPSTGFSFTGRFGIAADLGNGHVSLYLGEGSAMTYDGHSLETDSGNASQAEVRFAPSQEPDVTANAAVTYSEPAVDAPTVSPVADQEMLSTQPSLEIPFSVGGGTVPPEELEVSAFAVNPILFPEGSLVVSGSGTERVLTLTPARGIFASTTITIIVSDGTAFGAGSFEISVESAANFTGVLASLPEDAAVRHDNIVDNQTSTSVGVGAYNNVVERCVVFVFKLPNFGPIENPFVGSSFSFNFTGKTNNARATDLYGLAVRDAPAVLGSDYYGQSPDPDPTPGTVRIQEVILDNSTSTGILTTSFEAGFALTDYLNAAYDGGANAGKYVFLRLNTRVPLSGANRANVTMSEGGSEGPPDTRPHITYQLKFEGAPVDLWRLAQFGTVVPEGIAAPDADPDGDGWTNAQEYILGTDPMVPIVGPLLEFEPSGENYALRFMTRATDGPGYEGLRRYYSVEYSEDLSDWDDLDGATEILGADEEISVEFPAEKNTEFYRLRVWLD